MGPSPARSGDVLADIETPALVVDLDVLDANIAGMAAALAGTGIALRPHAKTHKSVEIATRQLAAGAVGLCAQKVSEAEAVLASGVADLLVTNHVVGARKLDRLCDLARRVRLTTLTSDARHVAMLSEAATRHRVELEILIEIDAGDARMGLQQPHALPALARWIATVQPIAEVTAFIQSDDEGVLDYPLPRGDRVTVTRIAPGAEASLIALADLELDADTFVWAAGEASALIPVRRYLRRELGLTRDQVVVDGYWKLGVAELDHHAPLDPDDPED